MNMSGFSIHNRACRSIASGSSRNGVHKRAPDVIKIITAGLEAGEMKPGDSVRARALLDYLHQNGLCTDLAGANAIGDALRSLGFRKRIKHIPAGWLIPDEMPVLGPNGPESPAVYHDHPTEAIDAVAELEEVMA
jgi:hypothetical protein